MASASSVEDGNHMIEREIKFELGPTEAVPRLEGAGGIARQADPVKSVLEATYFDTADLRLIGNAITLRRRTGGGDAGWHLKLPHASGHKEEVAEPLGQPGEPVPQRLRQRLPDPGVELAPVARITTTRYSHALLDSSGHPLATLVDDQVSAERTGGEFGKNTWREVEVELEADTADEVLDAIGDALDRLGVRRSRWPSKLRRVFGDRLPGGAG
ncbi:CYTH domain-containing protein [Saccharomonospora sp. NPDC006951]